MASAPAHPTHAGRVAIVTGAAQGIGRAIAAGLAARGADVVVADIKPLDETVALIGERATPRTLDVSDEAAWPALAADVGGVFGRVDIVVNNAAYLPRAAFDELATDTWRRTLAVNLDAHFFSAKALVPLMRRHRWGRIVAVASNSIGIAETGLSHYMASKMGEIGFVRGLANDLGQDGITVNAVLPALTDTPAIAGMPDELRRSIYRQQAIKRLGQPEDLVGPVAFLTSDDAAFITGQALVVDGGLYKIS